MSCKNLFISFSGGETSAFMTKWCLENLKDQYENIVVLFANTGQENEETLIFVDKCDKEYDFNVVWVEAEVNPEKRKGTRHRVVNFETASRKGEPFEDVIRKYGIPNQKFPHCTRELKLQPMKSYMRSIGWKKGDYDTAIGIRIDEIDRVSKSYKENNIIYPLIQNIEMTKPDINTFWITQPFRLDLKGYQGNCKWCWKKSLRKHFTLIEESPEYYDFPHAMEKKYGEYEAGKFSCFFRSSRTTEDMFKLYAESDFEKANDDSIIYIEKHGEINIDQSGGCSESCEIDFDELTED